MITFTRLLKTESPEYFYVYKKKYIIIDHLFANCCCVQELLELCEGWLLRKFEMQVAFEKHTILVGKYKGRNWFKLYFLFVSIIKL